MRKRFFICLSRIMLTAWWLISLGAFAVAKNQIPVLSPEARDYLNKALDIIQSSSVKQATNWEEFRRLTFEKAASAQTPADTYPAIRDALQRLGDKHSVLITPEQLKAMEQGRAASMFTDIGLQVKDLIVVIVYPNSAASRAAIELRDKILAINGRNLKTDGEYTDLIEEAKKNSAKGIELTVQRGKAEPRKIKLEFGEFDFNLPLQGRVVSEDVGLIVLPGFFAGFTDPKKAAEEANQFAERIQAMIRELDQKALRGWILDLRLNGGGNMWPMLAGLGPILGEGEVGGFVSAQGTSKMSYQDGQAMIFQNVQAKVATPYKAKSSEAPIAILTDEFTASSAEAIVIAFKGRPKTRCFGMATRGLPTANQPFKLIDGAVLNLTVAVDADRTGKTYDSSISPDQEIKTNWEQYGTDVDPVIKAAVNWLRSQQ